ncbi:hypothetical protein ABEX44_15410 [Priestia megaterium]
MYNYDNPIFYQYLLYRDVPYYFDNGSYYNQYRFNNLAFHPMYNHWQYNMHNSYKIRQPVKKDRLNPGEKLLPGQSLWSQNGQYALVMQTDGNLVQYKSGVALWASGTNGKKVDFAILQDDGNFVIYGGGGALWDTKTHGNKVAYLIVQDDGNIVIYGANGKPVWASKSAQPVKRDRLNPGEKLLPGQSLWSQNGQYALVMQTDGNLVQYKSGVALWASKTNGKKVDFAILQDDGNFVIYGGGGALWDTKTHGNKVAYLIVQDDGNIVIYGANGKPVWASKSAQLVVTPGDELVTLTKTIASFHYPHTPLQWRKYRVYFEVKVPKVIADSTQHTLDQCMEKAKGVAAGIIAPFVTPATMIGLPGAIPGALTAATSSFMGCVASDPKIYPHMNKIQVNIKSDKNA